MKKLRIIVVGGLSAGPSAAAKARRTNPNAEILLFEKTANISYATCGIPYALSGKIKSRDELLVVNPDLLRKRFQIDVHLNEPVIDIDPDQKLVTTDKGVYEFDKLVYAAGGTSVLPPIDNLADFDRWSHVKTLQDFDKIMTQGMLEKADHVTIIGGGLIGLETAENLIKARKRVTVIELGNQVLANWDLKFANMAASVLRENQIDLRLGVSVKAVDPVTGQLVLSDDTMLSTDYLLIGVSVRPNTQLLRSKGASYLPNGALIVDQNMETSLPGIYAAGDSASIPNQVIGEHDWFPMGTHSNKGGRTAGANAAGGNEKFKGGYGTAIMKLFDYTIARTGMGPKALKNKYIPFESSFIISGTTPGFYPDQKDLFLEIYFDPETKRLLGAELIGERGVDKRVDVLATAIYAGLTIYDLPQLDLAYAPPFNAAKDPVIVAGYVAANSQNNEYQEVSVSEAEALMNETDSAAFQILDVRNPSEIEKNGAVYGSINIPLDELPDRWSELNSSQQTLVYCAKGMRGYLASLVLVNAGFENVKNMAGGFTAWSRMIQQGEVLETV